MTKQNGVDVWPNAAIWMRDELRSKVRYNIKSVTSSANVQDVVQCHCHIRGPDVENPFYIYQ